MAVSFQGILLATLGLGAYAVQFSSRENATEPWCGDRGYLCERGRPRFHFTSRTNWINDPNGLIFYDGKYHMFFQHKASKEDTPEVAWGHAVSKDLLQWEQQDTDPLEAGEGDGAFSGSAIVDVENRSGLQTGRKPIFVAIYTYAQYHGRSFSTSQRLAFWNEVERKLITFAENDGIVIPQMEPPNHQARDPKVFWHEASQRYILVLFESQGHFGLYSSDNLRSWRKTQDLFIDAIECPDFFELQVSGEDTRLWVLWTASSNYQLGTFDGKRFKPQGQPRTAEYGVGYAPQTFSNEPRGRRVQISWVKWPGQFGAPPLEAQTVEQRRLPFIGSMSIPMEMDLVRLEDGSLRVRRQPVTEVASLRQHLLSGSFSIGKLSGEEEIETSGGVGVDVTLHVEIEQGSSLSLFLQGHVLLLTPGRVEMAETTSGRLSLPTEGNTVNLRILSDRTSLEIFDTTGGSSMALLPKSSQCSQGRWTSRVALSPSGSVIVHRLEMFEMRANWCN